MLLLAAFVLCGTSRRWPGAEVQELPPGMEQTRRSSTCSSMRCSRLSPGRPTLPAIVLGLYAVGLAIAGGRDLDRCHRFDGDTLACGSSGLAEPTGYPNAVAALFIGGFWPAVHLASRREVPWYLRGFLLAAAGFLVQLALMPQSRAALLTIPFALIFYLLVTPNRIRAFIFLALALGATAVAAPAILDVFSVAAETATSAPPWNSAADAMLIACAALLIVGTAAALIDRRFEVSESTAAIRRAQRRCVERRGRASSGSSSRSLRSATRSAGRATAGRISRATTTRGALDHPDSAATSVAADMTSGGLRSKTSSRPRRCSGRAPTTSRSAPRRPRHQRRAASTRTAFRFACSPAPGSSARCCSPDPSWRRWRRRSAAAPGHPIHWRGGVAAVALATAAYFFIHSSGDWLWTFAAITMPVMAWLGIAGGGFRLRGSRRRAGGASRTRERCRIGLAAGRWRGCGGR